MTQPWKGQGLNAHMPQQLSSRDLDKWALDILDRMLLMLSHDHTIVHQDGTKSEEVCLSHSE